MSTANVHDASTIAFHVWQALASQAEIIFGETERLTENSSDNGAEGGEAAGSDLAQEWQKLAARVDRLSRDVARCWLAQQYLARELAELRQQVPSLAAYVIRFEADPGQRTVLADRGDPGSTPITPAKEPPAQIPASEAWQWQTVKEVALALNVGEDTVRRYIRQGKLPAVRLPGGRGLRLRRADVERCLRSSD